MSIKQYEATDEKGRKVKRWKVDFYIDGHRERKKGFLTKKEAKEYESDFSKVYRKSDNMKLKHLADLYLEHCKARDSPNTYKTRSSIIETWILPKFGEKESSGITALDLSNWQNDMLESHLKSSTCRLVNSCMNALFKFAITFLDFPRNPVPSLKTEHLNEEKMYITLEQFEFLLDHEQDELYKHAMIILFWTGIRKGELLALKFKDFDLENRTLRIDKSYSTNTNVTTTPKTKNSIRTIYLNQEVIDSVNALKEILEENDIPIFNSIANSALLYHIKKLGRKCGLSFLTVHTFRHSHASFLFANGIDILVISKRLGHASTSTTLDVYTHMNEKMTDNLKKVLDQKKAND